MDSGSIKRAKKQPRLNRTLRRNPTVRPFEDDDYRYLWIAYKTGSFPFEGVEAAVVEVQGEDEEITEARAFRTVMEAAILATFDMGWILEADTPRGRMPVGVVFAVNTGRFLMLGNVAWLPLATARNKVETMVKFVSSVRKQAHAMWLSSKEDAPFYEHVGLHGIARRIGTSHFDGRQAMFEVKPWAP